MSPEVTSTSHPHVGADLRAAQALLDLSRMLMGVTLRAVAAAPVALTVPQHRVLLTIATDGPRRVGTLADDLGVNQSNASRIVDRLASQGLVHRRRDREDGRASLVELTSEGHDLLDAVREHRLAALLDVVARVPEDTIGLSSALEQLSAAAVGGVSRPHGHDDDKAGRKRRASTHGRTRTSGLGAGRGRS